MHARLEKKQKINSGGKKTKMKKAIATVLGILMLASYAAAYTVDGSLSDWGITPFTDWTPSSATANCEMHDYNGTNPIDNPSPFPDSPYGGELFDIELMCFDDAPGMAYFGSVVSMPPTGYGTYTMGDLALDLDANPSTGMLGYEYGIKLTGPDAGQICYLPKWKNATDIKPNSPGQFTCDGVGSVIKGEKATVKYVSAGIKDYPIGCTSGSHCLQNYVIEVGVKKSLIGLPEGTSGPIHLSQNCGNDDISLWITWNHQLPEFVTAGVPLLILVLAPAAAFVLVRKRQ
jgi:hypothetical protein